MSEIDKLESRITAALDRIRQGVGQMNVAAAKAAEPVPEVEDESAALRYQLAEEQAVNAQLEERVRVLKERQDGNVSELTAQSDTQARKVVELEAELEALRAAHVDLQEANETLRTAVAENTVSSQVDNRAEVEALKAQRAVDADEMDAIISELKPLIEKA